MKKMQEGGYRCYEKQINGKTHENIDRGVWNV